MYVHTCTLKLPATADVPVLRHGHYTLNAIARYVDLANSAVQGSNNVEMHAQVWGCLRNTLPWKLTTNVHMYIR